MKTPKTPKISKNRVPLLLTEQPKTKTKHLTGNHSIGHTVTKPKPKDWAHVTPSEGRTGKKKQAQKIKMKRAFWPAFYLRQRLAEIGAGTPECKWNIGSNFPFRKMTARDICYINHGLTRKAIEADNLVEIDYSESGRVLVIDDCSAWIKTEARNDSAPEICNT